MIKIEIVPADPSMPAIVTWLTEAEYIAQGAGDLDYSQLYRVTTSREDGRVISEVYPHGLTSPWSLN